MFLGIDWGKKKIGLATAHKKEKVATPLKTIRNQKNTVEKIQNICKEKKIEKIILGLPKSFDGQKHETAKKVERFAKKIEEVLQLPVEFENEVFSTKIAKKFSQEELDKRAATLILQSYLNRENK